MIYFLRHGLDDERYVGGYSNVGLTKEGIIGVRESSIKLKDYNISKIVSSDILRAKQTSLIVSSYLDVSVTYTPKLREMDKGLVNGMLKDEALKLYGEYMHTRDINKRFPNGESLMDLYLRIKDYLAEILTYEDTLFITHRGVINMIYFILNDIRLNYDKEAFNVTHASAHELDKEKMKIKKLF